MFQLKGLDKIANLLEEAPHELRKVADEKSQWAAESVVEIAKRYVPVRTGRLQRSLGYRRKGFMKWEAGSPLYYAGFVEFGTSRMAARPYLRPAIQQVLPQVRQHVIEQILEYIRKYGT